MPELYTCQLFRRYKREFLSWECWDFWRRQDHFQRFLKKSELFRRRPKSAEGEVIEKTLIHKIRDREEGIAIYLFYTWFSFLTWVWVQLCQARWQQLTFSIRHEKLARKREIEVFNPQAWELAGIELSDLQSRQSILWKGSGQSPRELKELPLEHITLIIDFTTNFEHWDCILNKFPYHLNLSEQLSDIHWDIKISSPSEFTATK